MNLTEKDLMKFERYKDLINKYFGNDFDKYWTTFLMIWIFENIENKNFDDIESIIIKTKNIVDRDERN